MRKFFASLILSLLMAGVCLASDTVPGDVIVVLRNTSGHSISSLKASGGVKSLSSVQTLASTHDVSIKNTYEALSEQSNLAFMLVHSDTKDEHELLREMKARPDVVAASLNHKIYLSDNERIPNDPQYYQLWGMEAINAPYAWGLSTGSEDVYVAIFDSGVDPNHPDLKDNISTEYSRNFGEYGQADYDPSEYNDFRDHGSHVAGTAAAVGNNGIGVAGVNWKAKIIALRVFPKTGSARDSLVVAALDYFTELLRNNPKLNIAAANFSLGGWDDRGDPWSLIEKKEVMWYAFKTIGDMNRTVLCVAAGNESHETGVPLPQNDTRRGIYQGTYAYPASFLGINGMITVAAGNRTYTRPYFSNYGRDFVEITAPGEAIFSTVSTSVNDSVLFDEIPRVYPYDNSDGTSMAAPHVTGAAALLKAIYPDATASEIRAAIVGGANGSYYRDDGTSMYGFLDLKGAIDFMNACRTDNLPPKITNTTAHDLDVNQTFILDLYASGSQPITWSIDGELPPGLSLDSKGIIGRPTKEGSYSFSVIAENDYGYDSLFLTMSVDKGTAPTITADEDSEIPINQRKMFTVDTSGSYPVTWTIESSDIPESFRLEFDRTTGIGRIVPDAAGTYSFTVKAENYAGSDTATLSFTVIESKDVPVIRTEALATAIRGMPFGISTSRDLGMYYVGIVEKSIVSAESFATVSWDVKGLPEGLSFTVRDNNSIMISGFASETGSFDVTIIASNDYGIDSRDYTLSVVDAAPFFMDQDHSLNFKRGVYDFKTFSMLGSAPMSYKVSGDMPKGMELVHGRLMFRLSGIPEETGTFPITVYATNVAATVSHDITITVTEPATITTNLLPDAEKGRAYTHKLKSLYDIPLSLAIIEGEIPGLTLSASGDITGTPTQAGIFTVTVRALLPDNSDVFSIKEYKLIVREAPAITTASLPDGKVSVPYGVTVLSADGTAPITWTVSGDLPAGLLISSNGYIQGIPAISGTFAFSLVAANRVGNDSKAFTVKIASADTNNNNPSPTPTPDSRDNTPVPTPSRVIINTGDARNLSSLTVGQVSQLTANGAMIGAILPEISVNVSDFYTYEDVKAFANVKISSDVPSGYALIWNTFADNTVNAPMSDAADDSAVFYDTEGNETKTVPANHTINVSAWLDAGKTYAPVISAVSSSDIRGVSSSSGGCNSGLAVMAVIAVMILAMRKERSR